VATLRAECVRTGVREVSVVRSRTGTGWTARLTPLVLRASAAVRLRRLARDAVHKEDLRQLVVPLAKGADAAGALTTLLRELVPDEDRVAS
jgi:hypothetical protein